ncbi:MAG: helicase C-terminal domain-containing protein [Candidatus Caldarchaeum sp.]
MKVLWLTRTASQVRHVAGETGALPVYGRRLLCIHEVISKIDQRRFNSACRATKYGHRCPYWPGKPRAVGRPLTVAELKELGGRLVTCPYEITMVSMPVSKALAATHRQLPLLGWLFAKWRTSRESTVLVLDEAQQVVKDALSMVRDSLSLRTLKRAADEALKHGFNDIAEELDTAVESYESTSDSEAEVDDLLPPLTDLMAAGEEVQEMKLRQNIAPASHLLSTADFKAALAGRKPLLVREGGYVRLEALTDPREELKKVYDGWAATVSLSATISAELVERLTGRDAVLLRAGWPFEDNLNAVLVKGLTTKYEMRDEKLVSDIRWVVEVLKGSGGKSLVFLPAFDLMPDIDTLKESQGMSQEEIDRVVASFHDGGGVLVAVFNGRLSEGVDLSAEMVALVGIPFSPPTPKNKMLLERLSEILGDDAKLYGVVLPAVYSAVQAAGRAIRGPEDRALILLIDDRYRRLVNLLPRWFRERVEDRAVGLTEVPILLERMR